MQTIDTTFKAQQAKSISLRNSTAKERRGKLKLLLKNFYEVIVAVKFNKEPLDILKSLSEVNHLGNCPLCFL